MPSANGDRRCEREEFERRLRGRLRECDNAFELLEAKRKEGLIDISYADADTLRQQLCESSRILNEVEDAGDDVWRDMKHGAERIVNDLHASLERLIRMPYTMKHENNQSSSSG